MELDDILSGPYHSLENKAPETKSITTHLILVYLMDLIAVLEEKLEEKEFQNQEVFEELYREAFAFVKEIEAPNVSRLFNAYRA